MSNLNYFSFFIDYGLQSKPKKPIFDSSYFYCLCFGRIELNIFYIKIFM